VGRKFPRPVKRRWSLLDCPPRPKGTAFAEMPRAGMQIGETKVIARSLIRRLEHLESRYQPPVGEPIILNIQFVAKDLKVGDQMQLTLDAPAAKDSGKRTQAWRRRFR
jgi:hypothetical protein